MKRNIIKLLFSIFVFAGMAADAQTVGNEWINFGNTYFKFKIGKNGIYRISKAQLDAIGMGTVPGNQFAILREGQEVPIYVTSGSAMLGDNDFIEFYAEAANGKMDTELYANPSHQPSDRYSLISDTAFYFLTYNTGSHQRITAVETTVPSPLPTPEAYFWFESTPNSKPLAFLSGVSYHTKEEFQSSQFEQGEGNVYSIRAAGGANYNLAVPAQRLYTAGTATLKMKIVGNSREYTHDATVQLNGEQILDTTFGKYAVVAFQMDVPVSKLVASNTLRFNNTQRYGVSDLWLRYPRNFNMSTFTDINFAVNVNPSSSTQYLQFTNVASTNDFYYYDNTNKLRYKADRSGTQVRLYLNPSAVERRGCLIDEAAISYITNLSSVTFRDYSNVANTGNYIILSNSEYINASTNNIEAYKNYRASATGGGYQPVVIDVKELYDQFGYGFEYHPSAIRRFLKFAYDNWEVKPEYVFIIGKGIHYHRYRSYIANPAVAEFATPIPTWGHPGSDHLLADFNNDNRPELAVGRLSAWNNEEIGLYLEKVKLYEQAIKQAANPNLENTMWKKRALHIAGGRDVALQAGQLVPQLKVCADIFADTLTGGSTHTVAKNTTDPTGTIDGSGIDSVINEGVGHITFFGHASATTFDYNLNNPDGYNPKPKFPIFYAFGCDVSQVFALNKTIGENYINSINGGSIAMIASDNLSFVANLKDYMSGLYRQFSYKNYGNTIGKQIQANLNELPSNISLDIHKQCILLQGDPALTMYSPEKPDYYIDDSGLSSLPTSITTSLDSFDLRVISYNLAQAVRDSILITLEHTKVGTSGVLYSDTVRRAILFSDTVVFRVPVNRITDVGLNNYTIRLNPNEAIDEMAFTNNQATLQIFIADNSLVPLYPREFAIVNKQGVTLKASALNAFEPSSEYRMELDTTANFDSPFKQVYSTTSRGGLIKWTPTITLRDSTVYYWRAAVNDTIEGQLKWSVSSFIYLEKGSEGWNQSHYYQYKRDEPYYGLRLPAATRKFQFAPFNNTLFVSNRVYYNANGDAGNIRVVLNDVNLGNTGCNLRGTIQISVFDARTGLPWANPPEGVAGSIGHCDSKNMYQFEFPYGTAEDRNNAAKFLDSIPDENYIVIKNYTNVGPPNNWNRKVVSDWMEDTELYGEGNTLYDKIKALGFTMIDSFTSNRTFIFIRKKGVENAEFPVVQRMSVDSLDIIREYYNFPSYPDTGTLRSTVIGPATQWDTLKWRTSQMEIVDSPFIKIFGIDNSGSETLVYQGTARDTSLSFISATTYPNIRMEWKSVDDSNRTSPHLDYWRVLYQPIPEAAINPIAYFSMKDSLKEGELAKMELAIENLTPQDMDSMLVRYKLIDANNVTHLLANKRFRKLPGNDTLIASFEFDPTPYKGINTIFIEANPDHDQPEQYHPNNLGYIPFHLESDQLNPLLDVTFDGIHILDKDIVSAKPFIKVLLRDENEFSALNDTSMVTMSLTYPNGNNVVIPFDGTICNFIPANLEAGKKNEARIEFKPTLPDDGVYTLEVRGKDKAGNLAGKTPMAYKVMFTVENKPSITNLLNYPNPFSTSTAFLFTLTGSEIPSQFKIQILTVTGKIVREITKDQLGPLHIGRNITEYKWDGRDEYGQLLGNGVYLYRVVTSIRGKEIEHRGNATVDKYFKNGFGKLYIMR
jgi:hypothetical protein